MPRQARKIVHVNQHVIKRNGKTGEREPVMTIKYRGTNTYGYYVDVVYNGVVIGTFRYEPDHPLSCGATVWFETRIADLVPRGPSEAAQTASVSIEEACSMVKELDPDLALSLAPELL